ncbi:hypothetical protein N1851_008027 [Merluccius polli]|uniref:Uncharacterized protein n=1 Tax=Merluccius polli TaxID=89951 RepID=A0AA47N371_MERPO|nr:hypothetical protein N1851_008027 [Merluccius polli]
MEEAHERKLKKYQALIFESLQNGWKAWNLPVEVGFAGQSLWRVLGLCGIEEPVRKRLVANIPKQAEAASRIEGPARKWLVTKITKQAEAASRWIRKWNERGQSQPGDGAESLTSFRKRLKTHLFRVHLDPA